MRNCTLYILNYAALFLLSLSLRRSFPAQTASRTNDFHSSSIGRLGIAVREDPIPGHLHEGGGGAQNQSAGVQSSSVVQKQKVYIGP